MRNSWQQKILYVDLSSGRIDTGQVSAEDSKKYIGGRGINAKMLWEMVKPGIDALSPENPLIFGTSVLQGTNVPTSGRTTVTCKSPATGRYLKSSGGGHWGNELRLAGWDYLVITGASPEPVYIWIDDDKVEIRPAGNVWGKSISQATWAVREELGDDFIQLASIGPAGENLVRFADINLSMHHACGRGGAGAVMGSKNLKAVAVRGTGSVSVHNPQEFYEYAKSVTRDLWADTSTPRRAAYGTSAGVLRGSEADTLPSYNFQQGHIEGAERLSGLNLVEAGYLTGRVACHACPTGCHRFVTNNKGPFAGVLGAGPEYETMAAFGSLCGNTDPESVMMANQLANDLGLDTISTGNVIAWAIETYERGLITKEDTGGLELTWGNGAAIVALVPMIMNRQGIGNILADGVRLAAAEIGGDSWKWAVQARGLEQSMVDTRASKSYALAFSVNPRGPDHLFTEPLAEYGATIESRKLVEQLTGDVKNADPHITNKRTEIVRWHEDCYGATDALGLCVFTSTAAYGVNPPNMARLFTLATGLEMTADELMLAARRVLTLEWCFNVREGATRAEMTLPWRLMNEPQKNPRYAAHVNSQEEMDAMLDLYYEAQGWDVVTGKPKPETLKMLGLDEVVDGQI
jgi:aldehyde:ferredoxin oxidoreductase